MKLKTPEHSFIDTGKWETYEKFQQKVFSTKVVGACKSFKIFRQITRFLENNGVLPSFLNGIFHYLISFTKL